MRGSKQLVHFSAKEPLIKKRVVRGGAFLGCCEDGLVKGVPSGRYLKSKNKKNKLYAVTAARLLKKRPSFGKLPLIDLWKRVLKKLHIKKKKHNDQMDVVLALFHNKLLR